MKNNLIFTLISVLFGSIFSLSAQDLLEALDKEFPDTPQYEISTFKATRISIGQSVENRKKGVLQLMALNRYWNIPEQIDQSFVADKASTRFAFEYALTDKLTTGGGWTTLEEVYDGYLKYNLLRQRKQAKKSPFTITLFQNASYRGERSIANTEIGFEDRLAFTSQVLIAHKFTPKFSLQVSPTFIHRSFALTDEDPHNHFALGFGGRYKIADHVSLVSEYYYVANPLKSRDTYGAFSLGVNWDVRFLQLQFQMTNARSMVEDGFILQTPNNFNTDDGNFVFGFNAIFSLHLLKKKL